MGQELTAQVADVVVVGECTCGCSSVQLSTGLPGTPGPDHVAVSSTGRSADGQRVRVALHVIRGRVHELELFDVDAGEGVAVDPAGVTALDAPEVG